MPNAIDTRYLPGILADIDVRGKMFLFEDFASGGITAGLTEVDVSPSGAAPTQVSAKGGQFLLQSSNDNETKASGISQNDILTWPIGWGPVFGCRFLVNTLPAAAGSIFHLGLQTGRNATPGSITEFLRFKAEADGDLLVDKEDNQSGGNDSDNDTGLDLVAGQYCTLVIDCRRRSDILFYASVDADDPLERVLAGTQFDFSTSGTGDFQILCEVQSTSAAQPSLSLDWIYCVADRGLDADTTVIPDHGTR